MSDLEALSDSLVEELMSEMADNFFGSRKRLEESMELFQARVGQLREIGAFVRERLSFLRALVPGEEAYEDLWRRLGVSSEPFAGPFAPPVVRSRRRPWALTLRSRWRKWLLLAYADVRTACSDYMHGRAYDDPRQRGRKLLTVNYLQLRAMHANITAALERMRADIPPSEVLGYAKSFDPVRMKQERVTGAMPEGYACSLDSAYDYKWEAFGCFGLTEYPELPEGDTAEDAVAAFAADRYDGAAVRSALQMVEKLPRGSVLAGPFDGKHVFRGGSD